MEPIDKFMFVTKSSHFRLFSIKCSPDLGHVLTFPVTLQNSRHVLMAESWVDVYLGRLVRLQTARSTTNNILTLWPFIWPPKFRATVVGVNLKQITADCADSCAFLTALSSVHFKLSTAGLFGQLCCEKKTLSNDTPSMIPKSLYAKYLFPPSDNSAIYNSRFTAPAILNCL